MFHKVLIANRGEIAVRIIKACKELGIATVALYTDADRSWSARHLADEAVNIGVGPASDSYLNIDKVIEAAKRTGSQAIHPGYGFLAEHAQFARRCEQEGLIFIGPSAEVIDLMGNKAKARERVADLGVPIIPGVNGSDLTDEELSSAAEDLGYPVMIKAVAGGGGMGIRVVHSISEFAAALSSVRHEAQAAFGDQRVLLEKYFPAVRHIEVQVLADGQGNAVHLFERECSVQRRRQKVIEEAPSGFVTEVLRKQLCDASLNIVNAVGYWGVGTVEFVVADNPEETAFYFLEMNTRLQVEHGVTEAVTGLDLVHLQIAVAEGRELPLCQADITLSGHAIECRLCAEAPAKGFQPVTGKVLAWSLPNTVHTRVDTGIREGTDISVYYDSLIAKLITTGSSRDQALRLMQSCLRQTCILGVDTNQHFLSRIVSDPVFIEARAATTYIEQNETVLLSPIAQVVCHELGVIGALASALEDTKRLKPGQGGAFHKTYDLVVNGIDLVVRLRHMGEGDYQVELGGQRYDVAVEMIADKEFDEFRVAINGFEKTYQIRTANQYLYIYIPGQGSFVLARATTLSEESLDDNSHGYTATMAGQVVAVLVNPGAEIKMGDKLIVIESMKMEHSVHANSAGIIKDIRVKEGIAVQAGALLLTLADKEDVP